MPASRSPDPLARFCRKACAPFRRNWAKTYLSIMCSTYPRVMNVVDDVLQRSLDLSCPEAARLVLLDPDPMEFDEEEGPPHDARLGHLSVLTTSNGNSGKPYQYFREIRGLVIWLLQYRAYPLWKRLVILGSLCDQLQEMAAAGQHSRDTRSCGVLSRRRESRPLWPGAQRTTHRNRLRNWSWSWS